MWLDHKNLEYFKKLQDLTVQQARWYLYLQEFNYQLVYKAGSMNRQADALSWREDLGEDTNNLVNQNITFFPDTIIAAHVVHI